MSNDDEDKVARLKSNSQPTRGRAEAASGGDTGTRGQVIQVATRCATLDEFVERFAAFAWESSLVLPAATALPVGTQGRFVILLRDQSVAMRGRCRVTESKPSPVSSRNPAVKKVMMRVALLEMDDASRAVHKRLVALRSAPVPLPVPPEPSETTQIEPARHGGAAAVVEARDAAAGTPPPAPTGPTTSPGVGAPPPAAAAPVPPVKPPPPAPPVSLNRTMIGVGIGPDGRAVLKHPTPPAVPPLVANPQAPVAATATPAPAPASAAQNLGTAATIIATVPAAGRAETRAPRAAETLPANPLSEFNAGEVDSFIECTLLEAEHAPASDAPDGPTSADAPLAVAAAAVRRTTAYVRIQKLAAKLPPPVQTGLRRAGPYVGVALAMLIVSYFLFHRSPVTPPVPVVAQAPTVAPNPTPAPPAPEAEAKAPAAEVAAPAEAPAPAKKLATADKPAPTKKTAAPAEKPEPDEAPAPEPAKKAPAPEAAAKPTVAAGTPGVCTARVITEPKDAKVLWGDKMIGRSPLDGARVPCGAMKVTIERERWQPVTVDVDMQSGDQAVVHQRLHRPPGTLVISSSPPGAHIVVNRAAVGAAPKHLEAMRYEKVAIKASLKGYKPWSKNLYLREAETKIDIELVPKK